MKKTPTYLAAGLLALAASARPVNADRQYTYCDPQKSKFCTGQIALYEFDEDSNYTRTSETGSARLVEPDGANVGRTSGLLGANGGTKYALNHTAAANQFLVLKDTVGFSGTFTINLWVKVSTAPSEGKSSRLLYIKDKNSDNGTYPMLYLYRYGNVQYVVFAVKQSISDTVTPTLVSPGPSWDANWHLISFGMYPTPTSTEPYQQTIWIALDGGPKQPQTITYPSIPAVGDLYIGEYINTGAVEWGAYAIDQMSVFSWVFSPADLTKFYDASDADQNGGKGLNFPFTVYGY